MESETVEQVCGFFHNRLNARGCRLWNPFLGYAYKHGNNDKLVVYIRKTFDEFQERVNAAHKRDIEELRTQVCIAKDALFKIARRNHLQDVHDIVCEAEFMMNHPECRNEVNNG